MKAAKTKVRSTKPKSAEKDDIVASIVDAMRGGVEEKCVAALNAYIRSCLGKYIQDASLHLVIGVREDLVRNNCGRVGKEAVKQATDELVKIAVSNRTLAVDEAVKSIKREYASTSSVLKSMTEALDLYVRKRVMQVMSSDSFASFLEKAVKGLAKKHQTNYIEGLDPPIEPTRLWNEMKPLLLDELRKGNR